MFPAGCSPSSAPRAAGDKPPYSDSAYRSRPASAASFVNSLGWASTRLAARNAGWLLRQQPIADTRLRGEIPRAGGVILGVPSQMGHVDAQVMGMIFRVGAPDFTEQLSVGDDASGVLDQRGEQAIFDRREVDSTPRTSTRRRARSIRRSPTVNVDSVDSRSTRA